MKKSKLLLILFVFVVFFGVVFNAKAIEPDARGNNKEKKTYYKGIICTYSGRRVLPKSGEGGFISFYKLPYAYSLKITCTNEECSDLSVQDYGALLAPDGSSRRVSVSGDTKSKIINRKNELGYKSGSGLKNCLGSIGFSKEETVTKEDEITDLGGMTIKGDTPKMEAKLDSDGEEHFSSLHEAKNADTKTSTQRVLSKKKIEFDQNKDEPSGKSGNNVSDWLSRVLAAVGKYKSNSKYNKVTCSSLLGDENIKLVRRGLFIIAIIGVVLVVALGSSDFVKAIASNDSDALSKARKSFKNRIISVVLLLLMPVLVDLLLSFINGNVYFRKINSDGSINNNSKIEIKIGKISDCYK